MCYNISTLYWNFCIIHLIMYINYTVVWWLHQACNVQFREILESQSRALIYSAKDQTFHRWCLCEAIGWQLVAISLLVFIVAIMMVKFSGGETTWLFIKVMQNFVHISPMKLVLALFYNMLMLLLWTLCCSLSNSWDVRCPDKVTSPTDAKVILLIVTDINTISLLNN